MAGVGAIARADHESLRASTCLSDRHLRLCLPDTYTQHSSKRTDAKLNHLRHHNIVAYLLHCFTSHAPSSPTYSTQTRSQDAYPRSALWQEPEHGLPFHRSHGSGLLRYVILLLTHGMVSSNSFVVTHVFHNPSAVSSELPGLLRGDDIKPSSNLGTNASSDRKVAPKAIIVGAGFSRSELDQMLQLEGADKLPWLYPSKLGMVQTGAGTLIGGDFMSSVVNRAKSVMKSHGLVEGREESVKPGVWDF